MKASLFLTQVKAWWETITGKITTTINDKKEAGAYFHESRLTKEYSIDGKWDTASVKDSIVAADIVASESPYPVKSRPAMRKGDGNIVKIAIKKTKGEKMIEKINTLLSLQKVVEAIKTIFDDAGKCVLGIKERVEFMFLQGLSTGYVTVSEISDDGTPTGNDVRLKLHFPTGNQFKVGVAWGQAGATPISDMQRVLDANSSITVAWMRTSTMNLMRNSLEAKRLGARAKLGYYPVDSQLAPLLNSEFIELIKSEYGVDIKLIDRKVRVEKNGKQTDVQPFDGDVVVFMEQDSDLGRIVYASLAEETNPVDGVTYAKFEEYIQLAQHSSIENDTPVEVTRAHARAIAVIDGSDQIYHLLHQEVDADLTPEEDAAPTLDPIADDATKADFTVTEANKVATKQALASAGVNVGNVSAVATLQSKVAAMSDAEWALFEADYNNIIANS